MTTICIVELFLFSLAQVVMLNVGRYSIVMHHVLNILTMLDRQNEILFQIVPLLTGMFVLLRNLNYVHFILFWPHCATSEANLFYITSTNTNTNTFWINFGKKNMMRSLSFKRFFRKYKRSIQIDVDYKWLKIAVSRLLAI